MDMYPRMLYRQPGAEEIHGGRFATLIVNSATEEEGAVAEGWRLTTPEAKAAREAELEQKATAATAAVAPTDDAAPPTRAELEQKATELGIKFDGRWGDKKLADAIAAALQA